MIGIRFQPPQVALSAKVRWVLVRGFGPPDRLFPETVDGAGAAALSRTLDLAPRIGARVPRDRLEAELGVVAARTVVSTYGVARLSWDALALLARAACAAAGEVGTPVVFLKGTALVLTGASLPGSRWAADVDVLVPEKHLDPLAAALRAKGFVSVGGLPECEHQLPPLQSPEGGTLELHRFLPGVRLPDEHGFATADALVAQGRLRPLDGLPGALVPDPVVLSAHALVHGIAQHGFAPGSYPLMRMLADLVDLGWGGGEGPRLEREALALTRRHVTEDEATAARVLCTMLEQGERVPAVLEGGAAPPLRLLAHVVAGALEPRYREALKLRVFGSGPSLLPRPLALVRDVARSLWPSRARLEALAGRHGSGFDAVVLRLERPFALAWRALRALRSAAALGGRSRTR